MQKSSNLRQKYTKLSNQLHSSRLQKVTMLWSESFWKPLNQVPLAKYSYSANIHSTQNHLSRSPRLFKYSWEDCIIYIHDVCFLWLSNFPDNDSGLQFLRSRMEQCWCWSLWGTVPTEYNPCSEVSVAGRSTANYQSRLNCFFLSEV